MNSHILIGDLADSREEAIHLSVKRYISNSNCSKCGFNIRLVSTWQCTRCLKRRKARLRGEPIVGTRKAAQFKRIMARNIGRTTYKSTPCGKCNNYDRLVSTNQCVNCLKERNRKGEKNQPYSKFKDRINSNRRSRAGRVKSRKYYRKISKRREYKITAFMRSSIRRLLSCQPYKKDSIRNLTYTRDDLISHLEMLFTDGMSWGNYGDWHIDHIKPIAAFISEGNVDINQVNSLSNLQPLWAYDNLSKGSNY